MNIKSVKLFSIPVSNQNRAKKFYLGVLGFELKKDKVSDPLQRWVEVGPQNADTSLTLLAWPPTLPVQRADGVILETANFDEDFHLLQERGVEFQGSTEFHDWGRLVSFRDPDGNRLVLQQTNVFERLI